MIVPHNVSVRDDKRGRRAHEGSKLQSVAISAQRDRTRPNARLVVRQISKRVALKSIGGSRMKLILVRSLTAIEAQSSCRKQQHTPEYR
jgi:hypothetical protein